jgi:hypothetical protein
MSSISGNPKSKIEKVVACAAKQAGGTFDFTFTGPTAGPSGFIGLIHLEGANS